MKRILNFIKSFFKDTQKELEICDHKECVKSALNDSEIKDILAESKGRTITFPVHCEKCNTAFYLQIKN